MVHTVGLSATPAPLGTQAWSDDRDSRPAVIFAASHRVEPLLAGQRPPWTDDDFHLTEEDLASRDSTTNAFEAWCAAQKPQRPPPPAPPATASARPAAQEPSAAGE
ncbi:hypothetical protein [Streptomyces sp. NPDC000405]|uniref:hypothetical protein n=1 Tax=Streptomyces sp. NPDC000405 TaxID=3161033 RepID=UPI00398C89FD